jgi:viroplasmin and RNaseH domain-containing protein
MEENDIVEYNIFASCGELNPEILVGCRYYYAVASGREKGIYEYFQYVYAYPRNS